MGADKLPSHEDCGGCRSVGSKINPSSQSQKMSIGIVADSAQKIRHGAGLAGKRSEPVAYHQTPINQNSTEGIPEKQDREPCLGKGTHFPGRDRSPWINTKEKSPALKNLIIHENQASASHFETKYKLNGFPQSHFVKSIDHATNSTKSKNQHLEAVNCDTTQQAAEEAAPDKTSVDNTAIYRPIHVLKMKLLEILGPDTLPEDDKELNDNQDQTRKTGSVSGNHVKNQKTDLNELGKMSTALLGIMLELLLKNLLLMLLLKVG